MTNSPRISPAVVAAKEELARGREKLKKQHDGGSPGIQVCNHFATLLEEIVVTLYRAALAELPATARAAIEPQVALVAHSGFGRREMAPYSDVDVMLLHGLASEREVLPLVRPALLAVALFSVTQAWNEFLYAYTFLRSSDVFTLPVGLAQLIVGDIQPWGVLMAGCLLTAFPVVIIYMLGQKYMVAGLTAGSVKG